MNSTLLATLFSTCLCLGGVAGCGNQSATAKNLQPAVEQDACKTLTIETCTLPGNDKKCLLYKLEDHKVCK